MRKKEIMKKGMAAALVCAMAFSAFALSNGNTYAANAVDLTKECSLTVEVEAGSLYEGDLDQMTIPVALYRVADVDVSGNYIQRWPDSKKSDWRRSAIRRLQMIGFQWHRLQPGS